MTAQELREALDWLDDPKHEDTLTLRDEFRVAYDAARIALAILEGPGEKVWWCESHHSTGNGIECDGYVAMDGHFKPCRMVERLLIPSPVDAQQKTPPTRR